MARDTIAAQGGQTFGVVTRVARQLGVGPESLRTWLRQAEIDSGQGRGHRAPMPSASPSWSGKFGSCAGPTTSSRRHRFSSRPSSTVVRGGSRLHRRPPEIFLRWAAMGGRADLPRAGDRPPPIGRPSPGRCRPERCPTPSWPLLVALFVANYSVYGRRKLTKAAQRAGIDVGRDQVARLMRQEGIRGASRATKRFTTRPIPPPCGLLTCSSVTSPPPKRTHVRRSAGHRAAQSPRMALCTGATRPENRPGSSNRPSLHQIQADSTSRPSAVGLARQRARR